MTRGNWRSASFAAAPVALLRLEDETVGSTGYVTIVPGDHTSRVYAKGIGALNKPCSGARDVDASDGPIGGAPEAVSHEVPVQPEAYDHPSRVYIHISKISPVGEVECAEETTLVPHKPMPGAGRSIEAEPCDLSSIVDGLRNGLAETGDIDHGNNPVGPPQETMIITHGVVIGPRDRSYRINTGGSCEAETESAGT